MSPRTRRLSRSVVGLVAVAIGVFAACACSNGEASDDSTIVPPPETTSCGATLPSGCTVVPSFSATIEPLVERTCATCHSPGGVAADRDLTTYKNIAELETTELVQLYSCQMPTADAGPDAMLSLAEREEMLQWFICGFPDN
jgi:hypothetical protein